MTHPESGTTSFAYNTDGSLQRKTDAKGQKHDHYYDSDGRLTEVRKLNSSSVEDTCQRVNYYYGSNPFDGSFSQNISGRLAAVARGCSSSGGGQFIEMYSYNSAGAVLKKRLRVNRGGAAVVDKDVTYGYGTDGKLSTAQYPGYSVPFTYTYDLMDRPTKMTGPGMLSQTMGSTFDHTKNVAYGVAGQVTSMDILRYESDNGNGTYSPVHFTETKTYDELFQLIRIQSLGTDVEYKFHATDNNGRIEERWNNISGQKVSYVYDELNRLKQAYTTAGAAFDQTHLIDGFGNFYKKNQASGADENVDLAIDQSKNRINSSGYSYDANGNMTARPALGGGSNAFTFDVDNRLLTAAVAGGTEEYNYLADNKRVWKKEPSGTEYVYFYGVGGQKLATYLVQTTPAFALLQTSVNVYFGGKLIRADGVAVASDRLGSVLGRSVAADSASVTSHDYFPYGAEIGSATAGNRDKFGTYHRDQSTGLDYADQRYYAAGNGRFLSADPFKATLCGKDTNVNRFAYVEGDPVNRYDPKGLFSVDPAGHSLEDWLAWKSSLPSVADPTGWGREPDLPYITLSRIQFPANWSYDCTDWTCNEVVLRLPTTDAIALGGTSQLAPFVAVAAAGGGGVLIQAGILTVQITVGALILAAAIEWWKAKTAEQDHNCRQTFLDNLKNCGSAYRVGDPQRTICYEAAAEAYRRCLGIGVN